MNVSERANKQTYRTIMRNDIGQTIKYYPSFEDQVIRDKYGDIKGNELFYIELKSFPIYLNVTDKQRERAGFKEYINAMFQVSTLEFTNKIGSLDQIDIMRHLISIDYDNRERRYRLDSATYQGNINSGYRYIILGGIEQT